jgi:pSer/pThr/pTyr-binding forkhead associated (FHA) protein
MKLVFPGGEHAAVSLAEGVITIGSDAACDVVLNGAGVAARHCEIAYGGGRASVRPLDPTAPTVLNGRQASGDTAIKDGDLLVLGRVGCSVTSGERQPAAVARPVAAAAADADDGRTRVRATLPKYMLRGVSGVTLGKTFAVTDNAVIGRQPDCEIPVPSEEVSRHHARLRLTPDGLYVEDMGSANGTWLNGKRVQSGHLKPGEELRLDTVRFLLVAPGMDARQQSVATRVEAPAAKPSSSSKGVWIAVCAVAVLAILGAVLHFAGVL